MGTRENKIEKYLVDEVEKLGGLCYKFVSPGRVGVPDRIIVHDRGVMFVEIKTPDGKLSESQIIKIRKIRKLGTPVKIIQTKEEVDYLMINYFKIDCNSHLFSNWNFKCEHCEDWVYPFSCDSCGGTKLSRNSCDSSY